jgi:hypothetical protein
VLACHESSPLFGGQNLKQAQRTALSVLTPLGVVAPVSLVTSQATWEGAAYGAPLHLSGVPHIPLSTTSCPLSPHVYVHDYYGLGTHQIQGARLVETELKGGVYSWDKTAHGHIGNGWNGEEWLVTNWAGSRPMSHSTSFYSKVDTWVEVGVHQGYFYNGKSNSSPATFDYLGPFWANNTRQNGHTYYQHELGASVVHSSKSYYQFSIDQKNASQKSFKIHDKVLSLSGGTLRSASADSTGDRDGITGSATAHWASGGLESTCNHNVHQYISNTYASVHAEKSGTWIAPAGALSGAGTWMHINYRAGYTGSYKFSMSETG